MILLIMVLVVVQVRVLVVVAQAAVAQQLLHYPKLLILKLQVMVQIGHGMFLKM